MNNVKVIMFNLFYNIFSGKDILNKSSADTLQDAYYVSGKIQSKNHVN